MPSNSGVDSSQDCSRVDHVLFETLINCPVDIANEIAPRDSGVDSSLDCSCVDCVLF